MRGGSPMEAPFLLDACHHVHTVLSPPVALQPLISAAPTSSSHPLPHTVHLGGGREERGEGEIRHSSPALRRGGALAP